MRLNSHLLKHFEVSVWRVLWEVSYDIKTSDNILCYQPKQLQEWCLESPLQSATAISPLTSGCAFQLGRCLRGLGATVSETSPNLVWNLWVTVLSDFTILLHHHA